ncbi:MAG: glycosyltransferase [Acidaminococcaceae bacterium]
MKGEFLVRILEIYFGTLINSAGGAERVFCNMANELAERGHAISTVCFEDKKGIPFYPLAEGVAFYNLQNIGEQIRVPRWRKLAREFLRFIGKNGFNDPYRNYRYKKAAKRLLLVLEKEKPDIVVCYDINSLQLLSKMKLDKIKNVFMLHMDAEDFLRNMKYDQFVALQSADCIQVLFSKYKEVLKGNLQSNIVVIPNVVPQLATEKIDENENVIINIARLEKNKQQHLLIEAFAKISSKFPEWYLYLYGSNSNKKYTRELEKRIRKYNLGNQVKLMGVTNNGIAVLQKAKIFAFPSEYEGFPLALTEAMSVGLPCIGSKSCLAVSQLIEDNETGILTDSTIDGLVKALECLIRDETLRGRLGRNAKKSMEAFTSEKIWNQWELLLYNVVAEKDIFGRK